MLLRGPLKMASISPEPLPSGLPRLQHLVILPVLETFLPDAVTLQLVPVKPSTPNVLTLYHPSPTTALLLTPS